MTATRVPRAAVGPLLVLLAGLVLGAGWALARGALPFAGLGLSAPPATVVAAIPVARVLASVSSGACLGLVLTALVARPTDGHARELGAHGFRVLGLARRAAVAWALTSSATALVLVLGGTGSSWDALASPGVVLQAMGTLEAPAGMLVAAVCAAVVAVVAAVTTSWRSTVVAAAVAALGVVAVAVTGPVASAGAGHDIATDAAVFAALATGIWLGVALSAVLDPTADAPETVVRAAGRLRPVTLVAAPVALVGTLVAEAPLVRGQWWSDLHGRWAGLQILLLLAAVGVAVLRRPRPAAQLCLLVGAAAAGAVAATEPAPAYRAPVTIQQVLLGFELAPPSFLGFLGPGRVNLLWLVVAAVLAAGYLAGHRRLLARGDPWPRGRLAAWLGGCALLVWTTNSGLGSQAMAVFSVHMGTHMILSMTVPVLLALGAPVTLALRALPAGTDGPRAWIVSLTETPASRLLTHPLVSLALFVGSLYGLYFSPIFAAALPYHWAHQLMWLHFLLVGYLFFWPIIGVDRSPRPLPHVARLALLLASMPFHAFFGVALLGADEVIGAQFYRQLALPWVPDLLGDQSLGGGIAWAAGEGPLLVVLVALLVQWSRADQREAGRADRRADRDGDADLAEWNAMLADLARRR